MALENILLSITLSEQVLYVCRTCESLLHDHDEEAYLVEVILPKVLHSVHGDVCVPGDGGNVSLSLATGWQHMLLESGDCWLVVCAPVSGRGATGGVGCHW